MNSWPLPKQPISQFFQLYLSQFIISMKNAIKVLNEADKTIILNPEKALYSLIWLHGLGDSSAGFFEFFQINHSPIHKGFRIKLLQAPIRPVTINNGMKCPSWYDIKILSSSGSSQDEAKKCNLDEVKESLSTLDKKVEEEAQFLRSQKLEGDVYKRIFVGGFSQGCAISVLYALTCKKQIGGAVGLSGYLFQSFDLPNLGKVPLLLNHGHHDNMIPFQMAKKSYQKIMKDPSVTFRPQQLDHEVSIEEAQQMTEWLTSRVNSK